jgi:hypothetical protein
MDLRRLFFLGSGVFAVLIAVGVVLQPQTQDRSDDWRSNDVEWELSATKVQEYRVEALKGNSVAARMLAYHYDATRNSEEYRRWLIFAASKGDCPAMLHLLANEALSEQQRGYWSKRAREISCDPSYYSRQNTDEGEPE